MTKRQDIIILPEDKIQLSQDQKNLIELALTKQVPTEDAEFMEKVQKDKDKDPFNELSKYFTTKYGNDFGMIYLSAIMGGEEKYNETVESIEEMRASERIEKQKKN